MEKEWLETLATINPTEVREIPVPLANFFFLISFGVNQVTYTDFVSAGSMLAKELREKGCDCIIALTHMRTPNDIR